MKIFEIKVTAISKTDNSTSKNVYRGLTSSVVNLIGREVSAPNKKYYKDINLSFNGCRVQVVNEKGNYSYDVVFCYQGSTYEVHRIIGKIKLLRCLDDLLTKNKIIN